jgi:hypothetical protein
MQGHSIRSGAPERLQIESTAIPIGGWGRLHAGRQGAQCRPHPGPRGGTGDTSAVREILRNDVHRGGRAYGRIRKIRTATNTGHF